MRAFDATRSPVSQGLSEGEPSSSSFIQRETERSAAVRGQSRDVRSAQQRLTGVAGASPVGVVTTQGSPVAAAPASRAEGTTEPAAGQGRGAVSQAAASAAEGLARARGIRAEAETLRGQAREIRAQLDRAVRSGATPDAGQLARLQGLRAQQRPLWRQVVELLRPVVEAERETASASMQERRREGASRHGRAVARREAAPQTEATAGFAEAEERVHRLERAANRDRLREIEAELRARGHDGALEQERDARVRGMDHFRRLSQGDRRWQGRAFLGNDGETLYNSNRRTGEVTVATMRAGGCGAISLAMVMAFYEREDPEAEIRGSEAVVEEALSVVRAAHAREMGGRISDGNQSGRAAEGTNWNRIATRAGQHLSNLRGALVSPGTIEAHLRAGRQVVWRKRQPGHFVVLSSIMRGRNPTTFHVSDPGFNDSEVTLAAIRANNEGLWMLDRAY